MRLSKLCAYINLQKQTEVPLGVTQNKIYMPSSKQAQCDGLILFKSKQKHANKI